MAKNQKLSKEEQDQADMEKRQQRVETMLPPKAEIPASISIQQAEELKARISELEEKLAQQKSPDNLVVRESNASAAKAETRKPASVPTSTSGNSSWLSRIWDWLIEAHPSITDLAERRSARLASSFLFAIAFLEFIGIVVRTPRLGLLVAFSGPLGTSLITTFLAYIISRTRGYRAAVFIFALAFGSVAYISMYSEGAQADFGTLILTFVPLSLIVASTFLSSWAVFLLTGLNVGAYLLVFKAGNLNPPENFVAQAGVVTTIGIVLILLSSFRNRNEQLRLNEFIEINLQLEDGKKNLEQRVADRTQDLKLAAEVGSSIAEKVENISVMLTDATEMIRSRFNLYYTQVYLMDASGQTITLQAGTGTAGRQLLQRGHHLLVNSSSLNGRAVAEKKPVIVADTETSGTFLPNPLLPKTRSEMAIPLIVVDKVLGVLDMQSEVANALNEDNVAAFQVLAGQLSVAIQNATLFAQSEEARKQVEDAARQVSTAGWQDFLNGTARGEKIGYVFDLNEVKPIERKSKAKSENALSIPITVTGATVGSIQVTQDEREWTASESEMIQSTAVQLAQHIENLRLLSQAEKYRLEAEQTTRRLTREGWENYLETRKALATGYSFKPNEIISENESTEIESASTHSVPIKIRDEAIGELTIDTENIDHEAMNDIFSAVAVQLGDHIENLRLFEETEISRLDIQKSQEQYELAVEGSNDGLWDWDIKTNQIYFSPRWKAMVGYGEDELNNGRADFEKLLHPQDHDAVIAAIANYLAGKTDAYDMEFRFQHKDGSYRWIGAKGKALRNAEGTAYRIAGSHTDITQRKNDEDALLQRTNQLTVLNRVMAVANSSLDLQFILQTATDEFRTLMQAFSAGVLLLDEKEDTLTLTTESYAIPDMPKLAGRSMPVSSNPATNKSIKSGDTVLVPYAQTDPILEPIHAIMKLRNIQSVLVTPLLSRNKIIGVFSVDTNDPTRRFDANDISLIETLAKQLASAIESVQLFEETQRRASALSTVAAVSTTTSTVLDPDELLQTVVSLTKERFNLYHTQIYLNDDAWNTLLLTAGAGEVGKQMVASGHAIQIDTQKSLVARAARERQAIIINDVRKEEGFLPNTLLPDTRAEMAVPMVVGDKLLGVFDVQSSNLKGFSQEDASIFTTLAAQVAIALQNARLYVEQAATVTQLRELDRLKSSFLANMSHELRTPLNSILGFADVMLEGLDGPLTENMNNDLGLIYKNGQHLLHLINDVLDMAKIDSGKMNLNIEKFNLQEAIEDVTSITSSLANDKNLALIIEPDSDHEVEINADKIRLRQVMINLVNNAIKFTEKGSVSIRVTREENNVLISIKDTGLGIPTSHLEAVFQEFTQVDTTTTRKAGGTGLGLPISRRLILMHKGRLWVESSGVEGEGSTFYVFLPIEANLDDEEEAKVK